MVIQQFSTPWRHCRLDFLVLCPLVEGFFCSHIYHQQPLLVSQYSGKISFYTPPPPTHTLPTHLSAEIVKEMTEVFDIEDTEQANEDTMECKCGWVGHLFFFVLVEP